MHIVRTGCHSGSRISSRGVNGMGDYFAGFWRACYTAKPKRSSHHDTPREHTEALSMALRG